MNRQESMGLAIIAAIVLILWWLSQNALGFLHGNVGVPGAGIAGAGVAGAASTASSAGSCC